MKTDVRQAFLAAMPALFVVLWSTGFVGARYAMPYAHPFGFLCLRFIGTLVLIGGYGLIIGAKWPRGHAIWHALLTGALIHAIYLGAVFWAVKHGFPSGFAALIVGLQPVVTMLISSRVLGEKVTRRQLAGFGIGLFGVILVLGPKLMTPVGPEALVQALVCFVGVIAMSLGTVLQKKLGSDGDLIGGTVVQYIGALMLGGLIALLTEPLEVEWTGELIFALFWLVIVLSIGAIGLLLVMIRAGEMTRVSSLFYLVPPVTAVMAFFLFGETLNVIQIVGIVVTSLGVALASMRGSRRLALRI